MNSKLQDKSTDLLFEAILNLKTVEECYSFFEDLCTVPELKAMSQRSSDTTPSSSGEAPKKTAENRRSSLASSSLV